MCKQTQTVGFPQSILSVSREEFDGIELTIRNGQDEPGELPQDLQGHVFIICPAGSVASLKISQDVNEHVILPSQDGWTPFYNGDGMVSRLSFEARKAQLMTRILKTPCYYADQATYENKEKYGEFAFQNVGISRLSLNKLGIRNQLNTGFLPVKFSHDQNERLLVTWDVGRPYEIDPTTLELVAPVGKNTDWNELSSLVRPVPFKQVMTSAHPCFDPYTNEMLTVNIGKSLSTMLGLSRSISTRLKKNISAIEIPLKKSRFKKDLREKVTNWLTFFIKGLQALEKFSQLFAKNDFVHLVCWDGQGVDISKKWNVVLPNGRSPKIEQTIHQMGVTQDYVVLAETSFKLVPENFLPYQSSEIANNAKVILADLLDYPQLPFTKLYIIRRADLKNSESKHQKLSPFSQRNFFKQLPTVVAKEVKVKPEFSHYQVDYENPDGKITLHIAHLGASDVAEVIRVFDRSVYDDRDDNKFDYNDFELSCNVQKLAGMVVGPMDVSRLGCCVIDGESAEVVSHKYTHNIDFTWAIVFSAYRDDQPTKKFTDIYWNSWGCWPDLLTKRTLDAYKDYEDRIIPIEQVLELTRQGIPSSLCRLHIDRGAQPEEIDLNLEDHYKFPPGFLGTSAQFVPRASTTGATEGYIVCVVLHSNESHTPKNNQPDNSEDWSNNTEIWVFDAEKLQNGPLCKLSHPKLNFGFMVHTTWLKEISPPPSTNYDVREDHDYLVKQQSLEIQELFEQEVYPKFKPNL